MEVYTTDIVGRSRIKFTEPVDMEIVERDIEKLFSNVYLQGSDYYNNKVNRTCDVTFHTFNHTNQTVDWSFKIEEPSRVGLNTEKSDYIYFFVNEDYDWQENLGFDIAPKNNTNTTESRML